MAICEISVWIFGDIFRCWAAVVFARHIQENVCQAAQACNHTAMSFTLGFPLNAFVAPRFINSFVLLWKVSVLKCSISNTIINMPIYFDENVMIDGPWFMEDS